MCGQSSGTPINQFDRAGLAMIDAWPQFKFLISIFDFRVSICLCLLFRCCFDLFGFLVFLGHERTRRLPGRGGSGP